MINFSSQLIIQLVYNLEFTSEFYLQVDYLKLKLMN